MATIFDENEVRIHPRFQRFEVTSGDCATLHYSGIDVSLEDVLRQRRQRFNEEWEKRKGSGWFTFVGYWGDEVVWSGNDVKAVLMPHGTEGGGVKLDCFTMGSAYHDIGWQWNWICALDELAETDDDDEEE